MKTWIFQGNPDEYDIDAYLASRPDQVVWLVNRYASDIAVGDRVYLWRNQGKLKATPGIVAECIVTASPELREEDAGAVRFWRTQSLRATAPQVRIVMRLVKVATTRGEIRRTWCEEDPILKDLPNIRMQAGTNYPVTNQQARRIVGLWNRTGRDWSYPELVAALAIYAETFGKPVSKLPGSRVAHVALMTGRAVSSVYAKVLNFRFLDPRSQGKGMSRAGAADANIWQQFYDPASSTIQIDALAREFERLWGDIGTQDEGIGVPEANGAAEFVVNEAEALESLTLEQLLAKYWVQAPRRAARPATRSLSARVYERDPLVIAIARTRASHQCEIHDCAHPTFATPRGHQYSEVHHIIPLASGGEDTIENVACLCPAHHKEIHLGARAAEMTKQLKAIRSLDLTDPLSQRRKADST